MFLFEIYKIKHTVLNQGLNKLVDGSFTSHYCGDVNQSEKEEETLIPLLVLKYFYTQIHLQSQIL